MPPRLFSSSAQASPLIFSLPSKRPVEKLLVGYAPASFKILVNTFVPYFGRPWPVTPCLLSPWTNFLFASLNFSGSFGGLLFRPVSSSTITLSPFDPMTAPGPPRPACRVGLNSMSVTATVALAIFISPTGPMEMHAILSPYSAFILSTRS